MTVREGLAHSFPSYNEYEASFSAYQTTDLTVFGENAMARQGDFKDRDAFIHGTTEDGGVILTIFSSTEDAEQMLMEDV